MRNQSAFFGCGTWRAWDSRHKLRLKFYDLSWNSPIPQLFSYWRVCRLFTNLSPSSGSVRCYLGLRAFSHPPHPVAALGWEWWQFAATREFLLIFFLCFDLLLFVLRKITFDSLQIKNEGRACVRCLMTACSFMIDCFSLRFSQRLQARAVDLPDL